MERCPICKNSDTDIYLVVRDPDGLFDAPFTLVRCKSCSLVFLRDIVQSDDLYNKRYYKSPKPVVAALFDIALNIFISNRLKLLQRYKSTPGRILDIGCGDGAFLLQMKKLGWEVFGIDSSPSALHYLKEKGITALGESFLDVTIQDKSVNVVTYWYSFEHIVNPVTYLEKTHQILKKDGIVVIAVQNIVSMQAVCTGKKWFHLDPPRHLLHFSPASLTYALNSAQFDIIDIDYRSLQMNIFGWYQSLLNIVDFQPNFFYKLLKRGHLDIKKFFLSLVINLVALPIVLPFAVVLAKLEEAKKRGGIITVIAKKRI
jgi:SAM-dependent methyltransferase